MKNSDYYNSISQSYGSSRYPSTPVSFNQFFFLRRRDLLLSSIKDLNEEHRACNKVLEIGCADGVVTTMIREVLPLTSSIVAVDIAPEMIAVASASKPLPNTVFMERVSLGTQENFDCIIGIGMLNLTPLEDELKDVCNHLTVGGYYICSLASKTSSLNKLKGSDAYFAHSKSFAEYETILSRHFTIEKKSVYGLFIPFLWKNASFGKAFQSKIESCLQRYIPSLFHECIYICKK